MQGHMTILGALCRARTDYIYIYFKRSIGNIRCDSSSYVRLHRFILFGLVCTYQITK
jgi:hypothetical protein